MTAQIISEQAAASIPVFLDDLLLDAQVELESVDLPELGAAVARARVELVRHDILEHAPPIQVVGYDDNLVAPAPMPSTHSMQRAETIARQFHARYEELAPSFGYQTRRESHKAWDEISLLHRQLMVATAAAVLQDMGERLDPAPRG